MKENCQKLFKAWTEIRNNSKKNQGFYTEQQGTLELLFLHLDFKNPENESRDHVD